VCFHRLGRLRDRTAELQQHRASGLTLVTAAIAMWNTAYLGRALDALRGRGENVPDALLAHVAPLDGSTSTSPAITFGMQMPQSAQMASDHCEPKTPHSSKPRDVYALFRLA
jgi:hypothetical protein